MYVSSAIRIQFHIILTSSYSKPPVVLAMFCQCNHSTHLHDFGLGVSDPVVLGRSHAAGDDEGAGHPVADVPYQRTACWSTYGGTANKEETEGESSRRVETKKR